MIDRIKKKDWQFLYLPIFILVSMTVIFFIALFYSYKAIIVLTFRSEQKNRKWLIK